MGQQQLLLLVMTVVLVGLAVVAGAHAVETQFDQRIADSIVERNLSIASDAVFWKTKRDPYAGGDAQYSGLAVEGMQKLFLSEETEGARFKITRATADELEITGVSVRNPQIAARTLVRGYEIVSTEIAFDGSIVIE